MIDNTEICKDCEDGWVYQSPKESVYRNTCLSCDKGRKLQKELQECGGD